MAGVNKVILVGNLGRDPETRHVRNGTAVCRLNLATTRSWFNKETNERSEETEWHRVTVWGKMGENCGKYLEKGRQVYVEGRLRTSSYEKDGVTRYSTEVVAEVVQFLGGGGESGGQSRGGERRGRAAEAGVVDCPPEDWGNDDIPF